MDAAKLKELVSRVKIELPKFERKAAEPREARMRDLKSEVQVDSLTGELFKGLAEQASLARKLQAIREPSSEVKMQIDVLTQAITETKSAIKADMGLYAQWMSGPLSTEDELTVAVDLAERGVLSEVSVEDAAKMKAAWQEYNQLLKMEKGDEEESNLRRPQRLFTTKEITGSNSSRQRFFVKRMIPKGEQFPEGYNRLMAAFVAHFKQKQAHYREMDRLAGTMVKELVVEEGKTLANVEAGEVVVAAFEVAAAHEWKSQDQRPLTGTVVVKCHGIEDGVARLELLGAVGSIYPSLRRHIEGNQVFAYKPGRAFEGMSKVSGEDQGWLRALLTKAGGLGNGQRRNQSGPGFAAQFLPQTPRGHRADEDQGPRKAKGRREKKVKGGGKSRTDLGRSAGDE